MSSKLSIDINVEVMAAQKVVAPAVKRLTKALAKLEPKNMPVGAVADLLYDLRQLGKLAATITAPIGEVVEPAVKLLEEHFINTLAVGESSGVQGQHSRIQVTDSVVPVVDDWVKFYAHIAKTKEFELLNRAVNVAAVRERWDAKKKVPGLGTFHHKKVSATKLSGKGGKK